MRIITSSIVQTPRELRAFNNWRLFFQVNCLSEICNAEGTKIAKCYLTFPITDIHHHKSKLSWPHQGKPSKKSFPVWLKILRLTFNINGMNGLPQPLGPWKIEEMKRHVEWAAYYDNGNKLVAIPATNSNGYKQYNPTAIRYRTASFLHSTPYVELENLTSNFLPVDIRMHIIRQSQSTEPMTNNASRDNG
jgi:hypothetical protein